MNVTETFIMTFAFQAPLICLIICVFVFITLGRNGISRMQQFLFRSLAVSCVLLMATEIWNGLMYYGILQASEKLLYMSVLFFVLLELINAILWSEMCISKCHEPPLVIVSAIRIVYFLIFVLIVGGIAFRNTDYFLYFSDGAINYGPLSRVCVSSCLVIYLLLLALLIGKLNDKHDYANREDYGRLIFATCIVFTALLLYIVTSLFPYLLWMGYLFVLIYFYMSMQRSIIFTDELTHLSNRRLMLKDIGDKVRSDTPWSFLLLDVNSFKQVNDTYGHSEGDRALAAVASVLSSVAFANHASAYRYGGDEFTILHDSVDEAQIRKICDEIDRQLEEYNISQGLPYNLSVSCGYAMCTEEAAPTVPDLMALADSRMYKEKQRKKAGLSSETE